MTLVKRKCKDKIGTLSSTCRAKYPSLQGTSELITGALDTDDKKAGVKKMLKGMGKKNKEKKGLAFRLAKKVRVTVADIIS